MTKRISSLSIPTNANKVTITEKFDRRLMSALKSIADYVCKELGVKYRSFSAMDSDDIFYSTTAGYNCDNDIRIRLRDNITKNYHKLSFLIDTVVHEVVHIKHNDHTKKFWKLHNKYFNKVMAQLKVAPFISLD